MSRPQGCQLYELARQALSAEFPGERVEQPKSLFWKSFEPALRDSLAVDNLLAYVVYDDFVDLADVEAAMGIASTYVPSGQIVIFAHQNARIDEDIARIHPDINVSVRFVASCPCGR